MKRNSEQLVFKLSYEQPPKEEIQLAGFLFNCYGILLEWQYAHENVLEFKNPGIEPSGLRLFIAPAMDKSIEKITSIEALEVFKPYEPVLRSATLEGNLEILPVPSYISKFWP